TVERGVIMSRSDKILLSDLMPRHLKTTAEVPSSVTIPVGSSMADAQRQLVLRTFANAGGDLARAGKVLGMGSDDVRRELLALVNAAPGEGTSATLADSPAVAFEDNGRVVKRSATPASSAAAKPAKRK